MRYGSFKVNRLNSLVLAIILIVSSCQINQNDIGKPISFYHWKSKAEYSSKIEQTLRETKADKIYIHYFDVDQVNNPTYNDNGIYPIYVIKEIDSNFVDYNIVPVVYITNQVFKAENLDITNLTGRIKDLIHQISLKHFKKEIHSIQVDCDWTQSTRYAYFSFLDILKKDFDIDVTIRLHQIKYKKETGIPPAEHGTLMLYNMGDFKKDEENSILESRIVQQYINHSTNYPLSLHLGLPLFSQTILTNNDNEHRIIKDVDRSLYETDSHFEKVDINHFKVITDTLYKGFYLTKGFTLKLEEINQNQIIESYQYIENSKLKIDEIIFYHLDDKTLNSTNVQTLIKNL